MLTYVVSSDILSRHLKNKVLRKKKIKKVVDKDGRLVIEYRSCR